ncbi:Spore protein SP21 [Anaerohalosphaera lusitana]|uniref:Spore protein SP21 n=1 Tax=Anaerohalosphaera lusitana TaxID=1936003 RepID=A0A1U9NI50_9BACT|nr:Hsp20/alpha crystallin family protein [Anaerohalosphaera lusitana]AQT67280.1 Spore protein SP21 [Anaerohalosphaera lusitana]
MTLYELMPRRKRGGSQVASGQADPFYALQKRTNDLFRDFFSDFGFEPMTEAGRWAKEFTPSINVSETDKAYKISAELPGMDENDIDVSIEGDSLLIKGEKKAEDQEEGENWFRSERSFGQFQRAIGLPVDVDEDKIEAEFKKGVLNVVLPKTEEARTKSKKISIKK